MAEPHEKILQKIDTVHTEVIGLIKDVEGINRRLDINNGRLAKNENKINDLEKTDAQVLTHIGNFMQDKVAANVDKKWNRREMIKVASSIVTTLIVAWLLVKTGLG